MSAEARKEVIKEDWFRNKGILRLRRRYAPGPRRPGQRSNGQYSHGPVSEPGLVSEPLALCAGSCQATSSEIFGTSSDR